MKSLPQNVEPYNRTPEYTEATVPAGLEQRHNTKAGVWAPSSSLARRPSCSVAKACGFE